MEPVNEEKKNTKGTFVIVSTIKIIFLKELVIKVVL